MSNFYSELLFSLPLNWKWDFFWSVKKIQSSGFPIGVLTNLKFFFHIVGGITESPQRTFEQFLMTTTSARSILVNLSPKKNLTSNRSKPIRVLTRISSSCSDDRLPNAYSLLDFQTIWSNFYTSLSLSLPEGRGSTRKKNRVHMTFRPVRIIHTDQATCHLIYSKILSTIDWLSRRRKKLIEYELQTIVQSCYSCSDL